MVYETSLSLLDRLQDTQNVRDWEFFVELYRPFIQNHLIRYSISSEDADDLGQETLMATYRSLPDFQHNGNAGAFRRWLLTICHQRALNFLRQKRRLPTCTTDLNDEAALDVSFLDSSFEEVWNREHDQYLVQRMLQLVEREFTKSTWIAFEQQVLRGQNALEAAELAGISVNAALIAKSRVLRRLREISTGLIEEWQL